MQAVIGKIYPNITNLSFTRNATWALSNFARGKPAPALDLILPMMPVLDVLLNLTDDDVLTDACWAASYVCDGDNERIQVH